MSFNEVDRAQVLAEALPYIQKFSGKTIVVKYGGNAMVSDGLRRAVISDIILLSLVGIHVVVVHGGGPEISEMLRKVGKEPRFVDGLRYTDGETMDIVQQVLCGRVNKDLVATLNRLGGRALGLCGLDGGMLQAKKLDERFGLVGEITRVDPRPVTDALANGYIPVVSTVARGRTRRPPTTSTPTPPRPSWPPPCRRRSCSSSPTCAACSGTPGTSPPSSPSCSCPPSPPWCGRGSSPGA